MCAQVNLLEAMENMDQETFDFRFGEELVYTTLLTDGQMVELIPGGSNLSVHYKDRSEFIHLVQKARMEESKQQVSLQLHFSYFFFGVNCFCFYSFIKTAKLNSPPFGSFF